MRIYLFKKFYSITSDSVSQFFLSLLFSRYRSEGIFLLMCAASLNAMSDTMDGWYSYATSDENSKYVHKQKIEDKMKIEVEDDVSETLSPSMIYYWILNIYICVCAVHCSVQCAICAKKILKPNVCGRLRSALCD